jgi:hypothetical protein
MRRVGLSVFTLIVAVALSGCIVLAAGAAAGGVMYFKGEAEKTYPHSVEKVFNAAVAGLKDANISIYSKGYDSTSGKIEAVLADGKDLKINLRAEGENVTKVKLRIGTFGDRDRSMFIYEKIDKHL